MKSLDSADCKLGAPQIDLNACLPIQRPANNPPTEVLPSSNDVDVSVTAPLYLTDYSSVLVCVFCSSRDKFSQEDSLLVLSSNVFLPQNATPSSAFQINADSTGSVRHRT